MEIYLLRSWKPLYSIEQALSLGSLKALAKSIENPTIKALSGKTEVMTCLFRYNKTSVGASGNSHAELLNLAGDILPLPSQTFVDAGASARHFVAYKDEWLVFRSGQQCIHFDNRFIEKARIPVTIKNNIISQGDNMMNSAYVEDDYLYVNGSEQSVYKICLNTPDKAYTPELVDCDIEDFCLLHKKIVLLKNTGKLWYHKTNTVSKLPYEETDKHCCYTHVRAGLKTLVVIGYFTGEKRSRMFLINPKTLTVWSHCDSPSSGSHTRTLCFVQIRKSNKNCVGIVTAEREKFCNVYVVSGRRIMSTGKSIIQHTDHLFAVLPIDRNEVWIAGFNYPVHKILF